MIQAPQSVRVLFFPSFRIERVNLFGSWLHSCTRLTCCVSAVCVCVRAGGADLSGPGEQRAGSHGDVLHQRPHWTLQHGDASARPEAGVCRAAR